MSVISPKTIVITAYPGKHGSITMQQQKTTDYNLLNTVDAFDIDSGGPKKRRRLTHLSPDEKLLRRKLKNRVAAQTARDRKKALMSELEEKVAQLEEENKHLRKQNTVLRETSETLVHENEALKSRLNETPVPVVKTESDTSSTCYSSAEGTSSDFVSTDGSLLHLCRDSKPNFLGILQDLTDSSQYSRSQTETATPASQSVTEQDRVSATNPSPRVVGLSSAELESLNELIHIDHVYFKPQPETPEVKEVPTSNIAHKTNKDLITASPKTVVAAAAAATTVAPGMKRNHSGNAVYPLVTSVKSASNLSHFNGDLKFNLDVSANVADTADDLISSLADSEIDPSMDFLQNLGFGDFLDNGNSVAGTPIVDTTTASALPAHVIHSSSTTSMKAPANSSSEELDPHKLFEEIYDSYVNNMNTSSPDPAVLSDSGFGSDVGEAPSPQSSEASLLDDYPWQDSFTDLFPDLQ